MSVSPLKMAPCLLLQGLIRSQCDVRADGAATGRGAAGGVRVCARMSVLQGTQTGTATDHRRWGSHGDWRKARLVGPHLMCV